MKKLTVIICSLALVALAAAPVLAADVQFRGELRERMFSDNKVELNDDNASNVYHDQRWRLRTVYTVNKNLRLTTQFDVHDGKDWGRSNEIYPTYSASRVRWNLEWDRAYMDIKTSWGDVQVGYAGSGSWGTNFLRYNQDANRIRVRTKLGGLQLIGLYEKWNEGDAGVSISDGDIDAFSVGAVYKAGAMEFGALYSLQMDKSGSTTANPLSNGADELTLHEIKPYFMGKFGAFNLEAQLHYQTGDIDYVSASKASLDLSGLAYNLEGKLNLGPVTVEAGYAFRSGDDQGTSDEFEKYVLGQQNRNIKQNWSLLHILTNDDGDFGDLGGNGNFSRNRGGTDNGYKIIYAGLHFKPLKDLVAGMRFGFATADQVAKGQDDQIGVETDIFFTYRMYKNLTYDFVFAWLNSGDYWREWQPGKKAPEDLFSTMQVLKLKF